MPIKETLIAALEQSYQEQCALVESLPDHERAATGTPDRWSVKDMIVHITVWSQWQMDELDTVARGEPLPVYGPDDDENARIFAAHQDWSWDAVRRLMDDTQARRMAYVRAADEATLSDPARSPWNDGKPAWHRFIGNFVTHALLHLASYYTERGQTERAIRLVDQLTDRLIALDDDAIWRSMALYNQACLYALAGRPEDAVKRLGESLRLNVGLVDWSRQDPDLASLRERADYQALYGG